MDFRFKPLLISAAMLITALASIQSNASRAPHFKGNRVPLLSEIKFTYEPYDGAGPIDCTHQVDRADNPYDLTVLCRDLTSKSGSLHSTTKQFTVHLALSQYTHPTPPRVSYELLYWVNETGASTWFHFDQETRLVKLESSQSIPNDVAGLRLTLLLKN